jgi:hypothetical protein
MYANNGVYSVGSYPTGGVQHSIPPGRYTLTVTPGRAGAGSFMRCSSVLCGLAYTEHSLGIENALTPDYSSVVDIEPTDVAVWLQGVRLTLVR